MFQVRKPVSHAYTCHKSTLFLERQSRKDEHERHKLRKVQQRNQELLETTLRKSIQCPALPNGSFYVFAMHHGLFGSHVS